MSSCHPFSFRICEVSWSSLSNSVISLHMMGIAFVSFSLFSYNLGFLHNLCFGVIIFTHPPHHHHPPHPSHHSHHTTHHPPIPPLPTPSTNPKNPATTHPQRKCGALMPYISGAPPHSLPIQ